MPKAFCQYARILSACLVALGCAMLLSGCETTAGRLQDFNTVVIDAGHGGHDPGARSRFSATEKELCLDTSIRLERYLREAGFRTVMTRRGDYFVTLDQRVAISNRTANAIFVSVHYNWAPRPHVSGIETFYNTSNPQSRLLAENIQNQLRRLGAVDRGVKTANFRVLRFARHPAVLVEGGFVSSPAEASKLNTAAYRDQVARRIADGIILSRYGTLNRTVVSRAGAGNDES